MYLNFRRPLVLKKGPEEGHHDQGGPCGPRDPAVADLPGREPPMLPERGARPVLENLEAAAQ